jgi:hypothetical protein
MVIGFACILGTTLALRAMMRKFALVYMLFLRAFRCRHCFKRYFAACLA